VHRRQSPSFSRTFLLLLVVDTLTVVAVYALLMNDNVGSLGAAGLLVAVIVAQTVRCGPFAPSLGWVATFPIAIAMAYLIADHPRLDWSGPGEPDEITFAPILPVIVVLYATGFALIALVTHVAVQTVRKPR